MGRPLQGSRDCKHLVAEVWVKVLLSPDFLSPASPTLLASSALACRQRRLLRSGWTLPGEARTAKGVDIFWLGRLASEPLPTAGFLKCGTINIVGRIILRGCPVLVRICRRIPGFYSPQLPLVTGKNISRNCKIPRGVVGAESPPSENHQSRFELCFYPQTPM